jgi:hypothetical protein
VSQCTSKGDGSRHERNKKDNISSLWLHWKTSRRDTPIAQSLKPVASLNGKLPPSLGTARHGPA